MATDKSAPSRTGSTEKEEVIIDAAGQPLGRLAVAIAHHLQAKHKRNRHPTVDYPIQVKLTNVNKVVFTGTKLQDTIVYRQTGYIGNTKEYRLGELWQRNPLRVIRAAVAGMLPKNRLRKHRLTRISIVRK